MKTGYLVLATILSFSAFSADHEALPRVSQFRQVSLLKAPELKDLQDSVYLVPTVEGGYTIHMMENDSSVESRKRVREALEGTSIFEILNQKLNDRVEILVENPETGKKELKSVHALGAVIAGAISQVSRNDGGLSRDFFFTNGSDELISATAFTERSEDLDRVKAIVRALRQHEQSMKKSDPSTSFKATAKVEDKQPAKKILAYQPTSENYAFQSNEPAVMKWLNRPVEIASNERAQTVLEAGRSWMGMRVGGGICNEFTERIANGRAGYGEKLGAISNGRLNGIELSPGQIMQWAPGASFGNVHTGGTGHYSMVDKVHPDGRIDILHQNMAGSPVIRQTVNPGNLRGSITIFQPE